MDFVDNYILIERQVKHARLRVSEDGIVRIIIPPYFSEDDVKELINKKRRWIEKNLNFFKNKAKITLQRNQILLYGNRYNYFYNSSFEKKILVDHEHKTIQAQRNLLDQATQEKWLKSVSKKFIKARVEELSTKLNFQYNKLYIRNQKTKWGNCSKEKNISINWKLIKAPLFVIDYIIVHELVHTQVMNHTTKFWTLLKSHYPDYKNAINWLDRYGNSL